MLHGDENYFTTISGRRFWPLDPRAEDVCIEDIAHSLAHICRFNGHVRAFYSVAQHSVLVSHQVPRDHALQGLLHDASEAYMADLSRVIKHDHSFGNFRTYEQSLQHVIYQKFGLPVWDVDSVKQADRVLLQDEVRCVAMNADVRPAYMRGPGFGLDITPWVPGKACQVFLSRFDELMKERGRG